MKFSESCRQKFRFYFLFLSSFWLAIGTNNAVGVVKTVFPFLSSFLAFNYEEHGVRALKSVENFCGTHFC